MKLCLGTAQLGLAYGVNNATGLPSEEGAIEILKAAKRCGFTMLDTSPQYGLAQRRIRDFMADNPGSFEIMTRGQIGYASVYTHTEAENVGEYVKDVQLPANLIDGRMDDAICDLQDKGKRVFVRSLILQGLLASDLNAGSFIFKDEARPYLEALHKIADEWEKDVIEICIRWAWWLMPDVAIIGCETSDQVRRVAEYWKMGALDKELVEDILDMRKGIPEKVISPRMWGQTYGFTTQAAQ